MCIIGCNFISGMKMYRQRGDILGRSKSYEDPSLSPSPHLGLVRRLDSISDGLEADGGPQPGH